MNGSKPESPTNILALVALAALLIFAAAAVGSMKTTAPAWISPEAADEVSSSARVFASSQVAAGATPTGVAAGETEVPKPSTKPLTAEERRKAIVQKCQELLAQGRETPPVTQKFTIGATESTTEEHKCVGVVRADNILQCVGKTATVSMNAKGEGTIQSAASIEVSIGVCKTKFCDMGKDCPTKELSGDQTLKQWTTDPDVYGGLTPEQQKAIASNLPSAEAEALARAFTAEGKDLDYQVTDATKAYEAARKTLDEFTKGCLSLECRDEKSVATENLHSREQELAALEAQKLRLAAARQVLTSPPPDRNDKDEEDKNTGPGTPDNTFVDTGGGGGPGGGDGGLAQFLQGFMKSLFGGGGAPPAGNQTPKAPGTCSPQTTCSNGTLFSRSNQCVDTPIQQCPNGCAGNTCAQASRQPVAQLSCQPQIADVGMSIAITYACSAGMSVGSGFDTGGASSGATTATLTTPPIGTNTASYGLTCTNQGLSANASCSVQIGKPSIVLVTNPKTVPMNTAAAIGWVTAGMQSCVIGSPDLPDFTSANAGNTNVNGAVTTPALTGPARFILHCVTLGGGTRDASSTIEVAGVAGAVSLAISKPTAGQNVALGGTVQIAWNSEGAPSGAKMRLEVYPAGSAVVQGNNDKGIVSALPASGTFTWSLPAAGAACLADSGIISCLTPGQYKIVAKLYTGSECWGFCTAAASERTIRVVAESSVFTVAP